MCCPQGQFAAQASLRAITSAEMTTGAFRVATLTIDVAAVPGTHSLSAVYGSYSATGTGESATVLPGPTFEIRVGQDRPPGDDRLSGVPGRWAADRVGSDGKPAPGGFGPGQRGWGSGGGRRLRDRIGGWFVLSASAC